MNVGEIFFMYDFSANIRNNFPAYVFSTDSRCLVQFTVNPVQFSVKNG